MSHKSHIYLMGLQLKLYNRLTPRNVIQYLKMTPKGFRPEFSTPH